jgi:predicted nucleotidyltransferase
VTPEELAQRMVGRHAERRRLDDARAEALSAVLRQEVSELLRGGVIDRAWLIGSLAWGGFGAGSDVDLVVAGLDAADAPALWDRLSERLGARVDLLRIEALDEAFAGRVRAEGRRIDDP